MAEFWSYFENGIWHIFSLIACQQILFLIVLTVPYVFKDWAKLLVLVSVFTLGNLLALLLSLLGAIIIKGNLMAFLIPLIILLVALLNIFTSGKSSKQVGINLIGFVTFLFGIIHGLGFSNYFNSMLKSTSQSKFVSILEFSLGIEVAQLGVVLLVLVLSYIFQTFFRFSKRDWILVMSSFVIGVVLPMILNNQIWNRFN